MGLEYFAKVQSNYEFEKGQRGCPSVQQCGLGPQLADFVAEVAFCSITIEPFRWERLR
jgi:hypothetical protein